jgi:hypothetical protein
MRFMEKFELGCGSKQPELEVASGYANCMAGGSRLVDFVEA